MIQIQLWIWDPVQGSTVKATWLESDWTVILLIVVNLKIIEIDKNYPPDPWPLPCYPYSGCPRSKWLSRDLRSLSAFLVYLFLKGFVVNNCACGNTIYIYIYIFSRIFRMSSYDSKILPMVVYPTWIILNIDKTILQRAYIHVINGQFKKKKFFAITKFKIFSKLLPITYLKRSLW